MCPRSGAELAWLAAIWLAALVYFWPVLAGGQTFYYRDSAGGYLPQAMLTASSLKAGELPLWEPNIGLGFPYHADPHSMLAYPLVLLLLLPFPLGYNLFVVAHVALAGTFTYLLLRRWQLAGSSAALGAFTMLFCGYTASCTSVTMLLKGSVWAAAALLAFEHYLAAGSWRALLTTALALATLGSGTDPQHLVFAWLLLFLARWLRPQETVPARWGWGLVLTPALAAGLLAFQLLPLAELLSQSERAAGAERHTTDGGFLVKPTQLANLIVPQPFDADSGPLALSNLFNDNRLYPDLFWGLPVLALASAGFSSVRGGRVLGALAALSLAMSVGPATVVYPLVMLALPPARLFRFGEKYFLLFAFAIATAAALGYEALGRDGGRSRGAVQKALLAGAAVLLLFIAGGMAVGGRFVTGSLELAVPGQRFLAAATPAGFDDRVARGWMFAATVMAGVAAVALVAVRRSRQLLWVLAVGTMAVATHRALPLTDAGPLIRPSETLRFLGSPCGRAASVEDGGTAPEPRSPAAAAGRGGSPLGRAPSVEDGGTAPEPRSPAAAAGRAGSPLGRAPSVEDGGTAPVPRSPAAAAGRGGSLQHQVEPPRFLTRGESVLVPPMDSPSMPKFVEWHGRLVLGHRGAPFGFQSLATSMALGIRSHRELMGELAGQPLETQRRVAAALGATRSIEYDLPAPDPPGAPVVGRENGVLVRSLEGATPRAFIAPRATSSTGPVRATTRVVLELPGHAIFEEPGPVRELAPRSIRECAITSYESSRLFVKFDLEGEGLLVVMDQYYPGWKAFVHGKERPILPVAGLVRGVRVSGGERRLEMRYQPRAFRAGAVCSALVLVAVLAGLLFARGRVETAFAAPAAAALAAFERQRIFWSHRGWWLAPVAAVLLLARPALFGPAVLFFRDTLDYYVPEAWSSATFSLWNGAGGLGQPALPDGRWLGLYPLAPILAGPFPLAYELFTFLHLLMAGLGTTGLLRRWQLGWPAASLGGLVMTLCGMTAGSVSFAPCLRALAWTPLVLLALERSISSGSAPGRRRWLAAAAGALVAEGLGTDGSFLAMSYTLALAYAWLRPGLAAHASPAPALVAIGVSSLLLAPRLLAESPLPTGAAETGPASLHPASVLAFLLPWPIPDPGSSLFITNFPGFQVPLHVDVYWGLPVLALAAASLGWLGAAPWRRTVTACVVLAAGSIGLSLAPAGPWQPARWLMLSVPCLAFLAALGLEGLRSAQPACGLLYRRALRVGLAFQAALLVWLWSDPAGLPAIWAGAPQASALLQHLGSQWQRSVSLAMQIPALAILAVRALPSGRLAAVAGLLAVLDLAHVADRHLLVSADPRVREPSAIGTALRAAVGPGTPARFISYPANELALGDQTSLLDVAWLRRELLAGLHGAPLGLQPLVDLAMPRSLPEAKLASLFAAAGSRDARDRLAASLGAVAAISPEGLGNAPGAGRELGRSGPVVLRALESPSPRAFVARRAEPAPAGVELPALRSLQALPGLALYEGGDGALAPRAVRRCVIRSYESDRVVIEVDLDGDGMLVVLDGHDPGWAATVDGQQRPLVRVAGLFRGVAVRAGDRLVEMRYRP